LNPSQILSGAFKVRGNDQYDALGKVARWYYSTEDSFPIVTKEGNKVPDSQGAMPIMKMLNEFPTNINYNYYINKAKEIASKLVKTNLLINS